MDRLKDLVELPDNDKVAPQFIESRLRSSPHIKDAWTLVGPQGDYVSAVIVINYDTVSRWAGKNRVAFTSFAELSQAPEVYELIRQDIARVNQTVPAESRVKRYVNLHKELDPDEGELTRTRNLRRAFLIERYRNIIDAIYSDNEAVPIQAQDGYSDGRAATIHASLRIQSV
jgi:long-chain acyl-CoA synthetase